MTAIATNLLGRRVRTSNDPRYPTKGITAIIVAVFTEGAGGCQHLQLLLELETFDKGKLWKKSYEEVEMVEEAL